MRTSNRFSYLQNIYNFERKQAELNRAQNRNIDERKFHDAFDDSISYSESVRLDNEIESLKLVKTAADRAANYTKNSDAAISEMSKKLDDFKVKLIQSTNQIHSSTSLNAIANDLQQLRNHIVNIANSSINGQFLFSGTAINIKPFNDDGSYNGNAENMQVLLGSKVLQSYNISGKELFIGRDNDYHKIISSNNRLIDRRYDTTQPENLHYLDEKSLIRDLIGREYMRKDAKHQLTDIDNFRGHEKLPDTYFYISGTRGDGTSIRAKFAMKENETLSALTKRIGEAFGNTDANKLVDVKITPSGTIELTDLANDHSRLNFSMFAATKRCTDEEVFYSPDANAAIADEVADAIAHNAAIDAAIAAGTPPEEAGEKKPVPAFALEPGTRGGDVADRDSIAELQELAHEDKVFLLDFCNNSRPGPDGLIDGQNYARAQFDVKDQFLRSNVAQHHKSGRIAAENDRLIDCCAAPINTDPAAWPHTELRVNVRSKSGKEYDLRIDLTEGCVRWEQDEMPPARPHIPATEMTPAIVHEDGADEGTDGAEEGADEGTGEGTGDTTAAAVPNNPAITGTTMDKIPGTALRYPRRMDFTEPVYDPARDVSFRRKSEPGDITFAQLGHIISMFAADRAPEHDIIADRAIPREVGIGTQLFDDDKALLERLFDDTDGMVNARMEHGKLMFEDCTSTTTNVRISIYDAINDGDEFAIAPGAKTAPGDVLTFATNSSIVVDEQQIDLVRDLDAMIAAVRSGQYRADAGSNGDANPGLQAALKRLDHLYDHVNKCHTKIGSMQRAIDSASERALVMNVNLQDVKASIIGARPEDKAETLMMITTTMNQFSAVLQTSAMINKISLLDYIR